MKHEPILQGKDHVAYESSKRYYKIIKVIRAYAQYLENWSILHKNVPLL